MTEKRFFEWHEDEVSVTLRNKGGSYGGGSEVLVISWSKEDEKTIDFSTDECNNNEDFSGIKSR